MNISLFITCYNDTLYPETGKAMVELFERLGHEVDFPFEQTCCGQMHFNTGYQRETLMMARKFVEIFRDTEVVVSPSASCVGMVHEFYPYLAQEHGDDALLKELETLAPKVFEFSEFLVKKLGITDVGAYYPHRVTYHPTCHSLRGLKVGDAPLTLLEHVRGLELVALEGAETCCGFGGTFAVKNADTSAAMLSDKLRNVQNTHAEVCAAVDNSCLMHIGGALHRQRSGVKTVHIAEILVATDQKKEQGARSKE